MSETKCDACGVSVDDVPGGLKEHFAANENPAHVEHIKRMLNEKTEPDSVPPPTPKRKRGSHG